VSPEPPSSPRASNTGLYDWDGKQLVSTLSPDGRFRWNGSAWVPNASASVATDNVRLGGRLVRVPTSWTRPLQNAVAGFYAISIVYLLVLAFLLSSEMAQAMTQGVQQSSVQQSNASPPPAVMVNGLTSFFAFVFWGGAVLGTAVSVLFITGALKRWTWIFYLQLAFMGLATIGLPFNLIAAIGRSTTPGITNLQALESWLQVMQGTASASLFAWMLVALRRYGPWATTSQYEWPVA